MTDKTSITVPLPITLERLDDLLCTAFEGGMSNQWCTNVSYGKRKRDYSGPEGVHEYCTAFRDGLSMRLKEDCGEGEKPKWHTLSLAKAKRGLELMAREYPRHFADFLHENDDAITGDVWLQLAVLGELRYG